MATLKIEYDGVTGKHTEVYEGDSFVLYKMFEAIITLIHYARKNAEGDKN